MEKPKVLSSDELEEFYVRLRDGAWAPNTDVARLLATISEDRGEIRRMAQMKHPGNIVAIHVEREMFRGGMIKACESVASLSMALASAIKVAREAAEEWDKAPQGMRAGKILIALGGNLKGYRPDTDKIHETLAACGG